MIQRFTCAAVLVICQLAGALRLARGPGVMDRLAAAQLLGTASVACLLVIAQNSGDDTARLVALLVALLGAASVAAFVHVSRSSVAADGGSA